MFYDRIVADNLDISVKARIQSIKSGNKSLHWTHQYAIADPVATASSYKEDQSPQRAIHDVSLDQILPTARANDALRQDFTILVSRIVTEYLARFSKYRKIVVHHIPHKHREQMAKKSDVVRLVFL